MYEALINTHHGGSGSGSGCGCNISNDNGFINDTINMESHNDSNNGNIRSILVIWSLFLITCY